MLKKQKALLLEDCEADYFIMRTLIEHNFPNIHLIHAYDGSEGLDIVKKEEDQLDFIFVDIDMPGMNGHAFLKNYFDKYAYNNAQVILLTTSNLIEDVKPAMQYGFVSRYIQKPVSREIIGDIFSCHLLV